MPVRRAAKSETGAASTRAAALEEGGLEAVERGVDGVGLVAAAHDVEGDGAHALGVHLLQLAGIVDLVGDLEVTVDLLDAVALLQGSDSGEQFAHRILLAVS